MAFKGGARIGIAAALTGLVLGLVLWRTQPGSVAPTTPTTPEDCLRFFREAVLWNDSQSVRNLLSEQLYSQQEQIIAQHQSRLEQAISWLIVHTQRQSDSAQVLVHQMHRDGWIYPVQYHLSLQGNSWCITRVSYLPPEKAPIAPGTHIREAPLGPTVSTASSSNELEAPDSEEPP